MSNFFWLKTVNITQGITPPLVFTRELKAELAKQVRIYSFKLEAETKTSPNMPVDTGNLKSSINAYETDDPMTRQVGDFNDNGKPEYNGYGIYQELGTSRTNVAHHFLAGAAMGLADKFFDAVAKAVGGHKTGDKQVTLEYFEGGK